MTRTGMRFSHRLLIAVPSAIVIIAFSALWAMSWIEAFVTDVDAYAQIIGSESACGMFENYCSWSKYAWSLVPGSILGIAGLAACAWSGWQRRLGAMPVLAVLVLLYLAWEAFTTYRPAL